MCIIYAITALKGRWRSIYKVNRRVTERRRIILADAFTRYCGRPNSGTSRFSPENAFEPLVSCHRRAYTGVQHHSKVVIRHSGEVVR